MVKIMTKKDDVNINIRAYDYILDLVAVNPNKFKTNDFGEYQGEVWGKIDGNHIYIIKSVFDREMGNQGFNSTAFLSWAKRMDLLVCDANKRTKKARITNGATNCVCIIKKNEEDLPEIDDDLEF